MVEADNIFSSALMLLMSNLALLHFMHDLVHERSDEENYCIVAGL